jgi:hypothetical protein
LRQGSVGCVRTGILPAGRPRDLEWTLVLAASVADLPHAVPGQRIVSEGLADAGHSEKAAAGAEKRTRNSAIGALGKPVRLRDMDHRKFVLRQPCLVCGRVPSDPHHLTFTQPRALGRRVSDEFTVPVCRAHHRELHLSGNELAWWRRLNIDPLPVALKLWQQSRAVAQSSKTTDVSAQNGSGTEP